MATAPGTPQSQHQWLVTVDGLTGYWAQRSGGAVAAPASKSFDGGSNVPFVLTGPPQPADITVERPFLVGRDDVMLTNLLQQVGFWQTTLHAQPTTPSLSPQGNITTWTGTLTTVTPPASNSDTNTVATIGLTFTLTAAA